MAGPSYNETWNGPQVRGGGLNLPDLFRHVFFHDGSVPGEAVHNPPLRLLKKKIFFFFFFLGGLCFFFFFFFWCLGGRAVFFFCVGVAGWVTGWLAGWLALLFFFFSWVGDRPPKYFFSKKIIKIISWCQSIQFYSDLFILIFIYFYDFFWIFKKFFLFFGWAPFVLFFSGCLGGRLIFFFLGGVVWRGVAWRGVAGWLAGWLALFFFKGGRVTRPPPQILFFQKKIILILFWCRSIQFYSSLFISSLIYFYDFFWIFKKKIFFLGLCFLGGWAKKFFFGLAWLGGWLGGPPFFFFFF